MDTLSRLDATESIRTMRARYGRCVDTQDWDGVLACWSEDGIFERGTISWTTDNPLPTDLEFRGRDAILAMIQQAGKGLSYVHHAFMPEIEILGETEAKGIWAMHSISRAIDNPKQIVIEVAGYYHETYAKQANGWVITSIVPQRLHVTTI